MQLVLSNNRIIAHGENFLSMGGVVINTETGAKYENATVAECENCPSDIGQVGYEYHAGVFVPCAPFGMGNKKGYVMEVCTECATPRNSGIKIKDLSAWETLAEISINQVGSSGGTKYVSFSVDTETLSYFSDFAVVVGEGMELHCGPNGGNDAEISCEGCSVNCIADTGSTQKAQGTISFPEGVLMYTTHRNSLDVNHRIKENGETFTEWDLSGTDFLTVSIHTSGEAYIKGNILLKGRRVKCI